MTSPFNTSHSAAPLDENQEAALSDRALAGWEIASVATSVVIAEWMAVSAAGLSKAIIAIPVALAVLLMILSHGLRRESVRDIGFRFDNFVKALSLLATPVVITALLCLLIGWRFGAPINFLRWHPGRYLALQLGMGFLWGLAQQYVLQGFLNRRAMIAAGRGWPSVLIVAAIFGLLHLPNPWITLITFVAGLIWAAIYQRVPNLFALAVTHAVMTWFIISTLPPAALHHLRVGLGYFF
ncbi:MAG TPA: CPBP family intramembrane glutamic endopeptidase [Pyrinomonadaceae bacterium]|nr:CPBP family intramembrane glutamic endopeptidase [Pyrinomonadaceae bacterium]